LGIDEELVDGYIMPGKPDDTGPLLRPAVRYVDPCGRIGPEEKVALALDDVRGVPAREIELRGHPLLPDSRHDDHQPGHRTDHYRVDERLQQRDYAFRDRLVGLRGRVGDGRGSL